MMIKSMKKSVFLVVFALMFLFGTMPAFAASNGSSNAAGGFSIPAAMTIKVGETKTLTVTEPAGKYGNVSFGYSSTYVKKSNYSAGSYWGKKAQISFTGIKPGTFDAMVTVDAHTQAGVSSSSYAKYKLYCKVTVTNGSTAAKVPLKGISMNRSSLSLNKGGAAQLSVSYSPANTTDSKAVTWYSSNTNVASVSGGKVTAKGPGSATITAKVGSFTSTCRVDVKVPLISISLNKTALTINKGSNAILTVGYNPGNTTDSKAVAWFSSNTSVAAVSGGKVTAKKAGSATITAKVGSKTAACKVTVKAPKKILKLSESSVTINKGSSFKLCVMSNILSVKKLTWSSSNTKVATVSDGTVTGKKAGTATITVKIGEKTATCKVTVKAPAKVLTLNKSSVSVNQGSSVTISVKSNTTGTKKVTWSSSNSKIATVSGGKVSGKKAGTVTITAKAGGKTATCKVTVKAKKASSAGSYKNVSDAYTILNTFRTTKANQWYWNSSDTKKVSASGLKKLSKNDALEKVAKQRAKESWTMYYERGIMTHTRPDGSKWSSIYPKGMMSKGENLAYGETTSSDVINNGWAEKNDKYANQGHRRNMLSSSFTKVGIACYVKDGKTCWAMCLGK